ncbi:chemotaxis regulatin CheY-phosphate phosphatase CheZ [Azospirillum brasilense]|nr:protein phosphatase CheZ [Azospirillum baldaniorum]TWA66180.1 chemotaxis regulatin CheY-phosphate phosphatase CheZ [Azospirillum baldaniorum]TWA80720.1 chemotaxis regulatin CheY-phosphate phosphatase CheZ [Azospirillum brasilense]
MDQLPQLSEEEFDQIEEAIARTTKGRAFLRRFHRRAHGAAAEEVRKMLLEFRSSWHQQSEVVEASKHVEVLRRELMEMAASIEQARREVAALRPPDAGGDKITSATNELDAIVISTERASFEILNAAERLMDLSGKLKADGADPGLCSEIEGEVTNIFTACSFQDLTGQRTSKVVNALRYIEQRVNAMINIWGVEKLAGLQIAPENTDTRPDSHLLNGPQLDGLGVSQADVDSMFDSPAMAAPPPAPEPPPAAPPASAPAAAAQTGAKASQADIDSLFDSPAPAPAAPAKASQADIDSLFDSPAPAPAPAAPAKASQADIDSLFDSPAPAPAEAPPAPPPAPAAKKPVPKPASAAKPAPKPAPAAKPAAAPPPAADEPPAPLDQAAIDALFG